MSATPLSLSDKVSQSTTRSQQGDTGGERKRTGRACDRCRMRKIKCDGIGPCSKCKSNDSICVWGKKKRVRDKIYPKGYVEVLEQQHAQVVTGLQELYHRLLKASAWEGSPLEETDGRPLTHSILSALNLLEVEHADSVNLDLIDQDCESMQSTMNPKRAVHTQRRGSLRSNSEHSHCERLRVAYNHETSVQPTPAALESRLDKSIAISPPLALSAVPHPERSVRPQVQAAQPYTSPLFSPLPAFTTDHAHSRTPEWAQALPYEIESDQSFSLDYATVQHLDSDVSLGSPWNQLLSQYDLSDQSSTTPCSARFYYQ